MASDARIRNYEERISDLLRRNRQYKATILQLETELSFYRSREAQVVIAAEAEQE